MERNRVEGDEGSHGNEEKLTLCLDGGFPWFHIVWCRVV